MGNNNKTRKNYIQLKKHVKKKVAQAKRQYKINLSKSISLFVCLFVVFPNPKHFYA